MISIPFGTALGLARSRLHANPKSTAPYGMSSALAAAETTGGSESRETARDFNPRLYPEKKHRRGCRRDGGHWSDDGFCVSAEGHFVQLIGYQRGRLPRRKTGKRGSLFTNAANFAKRFSVYRDRSAMWRRNCYLPIFFYWYISLSLILNISLILRINSTFAEIST